METDIRKLRWIGSRPGERCEIKWRKSQSASKSFDRGPGTEQKSVSVQACLFYAVNIAMCFAIARRNTCICFLVFSSGMQSFSRLSRCVASISFSPGFSPAPSPRTCEILKTSPGVVRKSALPGESRGCRGKGERRRKTTAAQC